MFSIRDIRPDDLPKVYEFTVKLLRHHIGQCEKSYLEQAGLARLFQNGFLKGLLLIRTSIQQGNNATIPTRSGAENDAAIGFMIFHADISLVRGGHGICLDQFFIEPDYRKLGLGRLMMTALSKLVLASGGNYIKLLYQDGLGLDKVYANMGFVNYSKNNIKLHLLECYGKADLQRFLHNVDELAATVANGSTSPSTAKRQVLILPFATSEDAHGSTLPVWSTVASVDLDQCGAEQRDLIPQARLIVVAEAGPCRDSPAMTDTDRTAAPGLLSHLHSRLCVFVEQACICCWLGPMVNFADFVGDTTILDTDLFRTRIHSWVQCSDQISGAVWEVPMGSCEPEDVTGGQQPDGFVPTTHTPFTPMATKLSDVGVRDYTTDEGWNIAYLDQSGMRKLVELSEASSNGM